MATVFKRTRSKPIPAGAEISDVKGKQYATWLKGKQRKRAPLAESGVEILVEDENYQIEYTDHRGERKHKSSKCREKSVAEQLATKLETEATRRREGLIDAAHERIRDSSQMLIETHLTDFEAKMSAAARDGKHVTSTLSQIRKIVAHCAWQRAIEINSDGVYRFVATLRDKKRGSSNRNVQAHLTSIKSFTKWLAKNHKLAFDPLADVDRPTPRTDRRMERRPLEHTEWDCLIGTLAGSGEAYGLSGEERALLYSVAVQTGLRSGELRDLRRAHLYLAGDSPYIRAKAAISKNSKEAKQYLSLDVAAALAKQIKTKAPNAPVFSLPRANDEMALMIREDLAAARAAWLHEAAGDCEERVRREESDFLQEQNDRGETLDFHALRHTCGAWYIEAGASPKEVQALMRHSTITLTMDTYGHLFKGQEAETVKKLRPLLNAGEKCSWNHQSSAAPTGRHGSSDAADCRDAAAGLETSNPSRYNAFDVDRRRMPPRAADCRSISEGKRTGQRSDSKSDAPQGVVGSNPMPSAC
jgi:integrase